MALSPITTLHAKIVGGIPDLQNAVSIISAVAGKAKLIINEEWLSIQVVSHQQQESAGEFIAELRLRNTGCQEYEYKRVGDKQHLCNYGVNNLAGFQELLSRATEQDGLSITFDPYARFLLGLALFDISAAPPNADPLGIEEDPVVSEEQALAALRRCFSSPLISTAQPKVKGVDKVGDGSTGGVEKAEKRPLADIAADDSKEKKKQKQEAGPAEINSDSDQPQQPSVLGGSGQTISAQTGATDDRYLELALTIPTTIYASPVVADEKGYRVTASIPSQSFFNNLKGLKYDAIPVTDAPVLHITINRTELVFHSPGVDVLLKQEKEGLEIKGATDDDEFKLTFPFANLEPLKRATRMPGTGRASIHIEHPQGCKPLLNCPVGPEGQLGNLFFSGL